MNIGEAAKLCGISAKRIRHYEEQGLLAKAPRSEAGYRRYTHDDLRRLNFIRHARELGFGLEQIRELLSLWEDGARASREVKAIALSHIAELERKITAMQAMKEALLELADACQGDQRPDCPILNAIAQGGCAG
ncbi:Cu(I)-responsive transcriptional regulator [Niveibacterium terrae]|uniref:Cu(I)-responsive transcriptional regulator n=1 Tax=Niveibacterium terrae TaxID=3373598 RepID=UPI003A924F7A